MTHYERQLLLLLAEVAASELEQQAQARGTTSNIAAQIRRYVEEIHDTGESQGT